MSSRWAIGVVVAGVCSLIPVGEPPRATADVWSNPERLSNAGGNTTAPAVSSNSSGTAIAVWLRAVYNDGSDPTPCDELDICVVEAARFDPVTEQWGRPVRLSWPGVNTSEVDVLVDESGRAVAVWRRPSRGVIEASVFNGRAWDAGPTALSEPDSGSRGARLAVRPDGSFAVAWYRPQAMVNVIEVAQYAQGRWSTPRELAREPEATISGITDDGGGGLVAVWRSKLDATGPFVIRASRKTETWSEPVTITDPAAPDSDKAQVTAGSAGHAVAVWQQGDEEHTVIKLSRYDMATNLWSAPEDLSAPDINAANPRAASDQAGNVMVLWRARSAAGFSTVQAIRYNASTGAWSSVAVLSNTTRQAQSHQLAVDTSGQVTAVWRIADEDDHWTVQAARYSPVTDEWGAARDLSGPDLEAMSPSTDVDAAGNVIVVWAREDLIQASRSSAKPGFVAVSPVRVFDTRPDQSPNALRAVSKVKVGGSVELAVDMASLPGGATPARGFGAVALNVTVVDPDHNGFLTVYPCGKRVEVSNVNFVAGQIVANSVIAPVSSNGTLCFFSNTPVHVVVDLNGYFATSSGFHAMGPLRIFDTRPNSSLQALLTVPKARIGGSTELRVPMTSLPAGSTPVEGISAVSLNVTVVNPSAEGFVTVYPCGERESVSSVNFAANQTVSNSVIAPLADNGDLCFFSNVSTDLVVDIAGWFATGSSFVAATTPERAFDTRSKQSPDARLDILKGKIGGTTQLRVRLTDLAGMTPPLGVEAVSLNVTAADANGNGFVTVYPCDTPKEVSSVNFRTGQTVANAVIAPVSPSGDLCFFSNVLTHLVVDINGYFATSN